MDLFSAEFSLGVAVLVFLIYICIDGMYAYYTIAVTGKQPFKAATVGSAMHFLIALGVLNYTENSFYIIPLALGSWVGTYAVVRQRS